MDPSDQSRSRAARRLRIGLTCATLALVCACGGKSAPSDDAPAAGGVAPLIARAERAAEAGDFEAAVSAYAEAYTRTPWNTRLRTALVSARVARAAQLRSAGKGRASVEAAERELREAIALEPGSAEVQRNLSIVLLERAAYESDDEVAALLRAEAERLAPGVTQAVPDVRFSVERRLDLAIEEIERGQLDAGIDRLERLNQEAEGRVDVKRLLAQAEVRKGLELSARRNWNGAGERYARALALYAEIAPCDGGHCSREELRTAHYNHTANWVLADEPLPARRALDAATAEGFEFPDLRSELEQRELISH